MKIYIPLFLLIAVKGFTQNSADPILHGSVQKEQQLVDAIAVGDKAIWLSALEDSCIITLEDGSYMTKEKFVADLSPLPPAYKGMIKVIEPKKKLYGNTAVLTFINDEYLELYGQKIHTQYRQTDTWVKINSDWKMIAMQLFEIPANPPPVVLPEATLSRYTGVYELGSDRKCTVTVTNGKLYAQKNNSDAVELLAETENVFFRNGEGRVRVIFSKEENSNNYRMIERRAGQDVVWKKV